MVFKKDSNYNFFSMINIFFLFFMTISFNLFSQSEKYRVEFSECMIYDCEGIPDDVQWGYLFVPEDRNNPNSSMIKLAFAVLKSKSNNPLPDPVVYFDGGPGLRTLDGFWNWLNHPIRENRDIILLDQRGTGYSQPTFCPNLGADLFDIIARDLTSKEAIAAKTEMVLKCRDSLSEKGINLNVFNSVSNAADFNDLRIALGYDTWNVLSISYGTRLAQAYMRQYSSSVRSLILDSVVVPDIPYFSLINENFDQALNHLFEECSKDPNCNTSYPDIKSDFYKGLKKLKRDPVTVNYSRGEFTMNNQDMLLGIHQLLYDYKSVKLLPTIIKEFAAGNENIISVFANLLFEKTGSMDYGVYYAIMCNETFPCNSFESYLENEAKYPELLGGLIFYASDFYACKDWNKKESDSLICSSIKARTPTLILTGKYDPITPSSNGKYLAESLEKSYFFEFSESGHAPSLESCGKDLINKFVQNPEIRPEIPCLYEGIQSRPFITDINLNGGVYNFLDKVFIKGNLVYLLGFGLCLLVFISVILSSLFLFLKRVIRRKKIIERENLISWFRRLAKVTSILGFVFLAALIFIIITVANDNFYVLALGLPKSYSAILILPYFILLASFILAVLWIKIHKSKLGRVGAFYNVALIAFCVLIFFIIRLECFLLI